MERILTQPSSPKTIPWDNPFGTFPPKKKDQREKHSSLDKGHSKMDGYNTRPTRAEPVRPLTSQGHRGREDSRPSTSQGHLQTNPPQNLLSHPHENSSPPQAEMGLFRKDKRKDGNLQQPGATSLPIRPVQRAMTAPSPQEQYLPAVSPNSMPQAPDMRHNDYPQRKVRANVNEEMHDAIDQTEQSMHFAPSRNVDRRRPSQHEYNQPLAQVRPADNYDQNTYRGIPKTNTSMTRPSTSEQSGLDMPNFEANPNSPHERNEEHWDAPAGVQNQSAYQKQTYQAPVPSHIQTGDRGVRSPGGEADTLRSPLADFSFDLPASNPAPATPSSYQQPRRAYTQDSHHSQTDNPSFKATHPFTENTRQSPPRHPGQFPPRTASRAEPQPRATTEGYRRPSQGAHDYSQPRGPPQTQRPSTSHSQRGGPEAYVVQPVQPWEDRSRSNRSPQITQPQRYGGPQQPYQDQGRYGPPSQQPTQDQSTYGATSQQPYQEPSRYNTGPQYVQAPQRPRQEPGRYEAEEQYVRGYQQESAQMYDQSYNYGDQYATTERGGYPQQAYTQGYSNDHSYDQEYRHSPPQSGRSMDAYAQDPVRPRTANSARPPPVRHYPEPSSAAGNFNQAGATGMGVTNPDALPAHPPPVRPGLAAATAPPQPAQQPSQPQNTSNRAPQVQSPSEPPVTIAELSMLRESIKNKPNDHATGLKFAKRLVEAAKLLADEGGRADPKQTAKNRERYIFDAHKVVKKLVSAGYPEAMFYLADCYGSGMLGLAPDPKEAFSLYQSAAKLGHPPSAYRVAVCCELGSEEGGGTRRDPMKSVQWYKRAATLGDTAAMYKIGMVLLKGLLGQPKNPREAVSWLKRAAERADKENPHALHELGLLYESAAPNDSIVRDEKYSFQLFREAAELGYKYSQFRLGSAFEYGLLGCNIDARQSIAWYSRAAAQGEHQSELALSGWYLTGSEPLLQQSDTEAYLWARKAASSGLAKAEYAMGYFTEVGIGCAANIDDAKRWYYRAACKFTLSPVLTLY